MTMTTLSSEGRLRRLCGGMIKRNRSFMLYFGVLLFVLYPLQYMLHIFDENFDKRLVSYSNGMGSLNLMGRANPHLTESIAILLCMAVFLMTLVIGLSQFSYLHSKKAVDVYHELPLNRSTLALANVITGFVTVMLPLAANYLVVLVVGVIKWAVNPLFPFIAAGLVIDLLCWAVVVLAVLSIIAFVAVQVGSIFDNFLFSCELLVVFPAVIYLTINLFQHMLRGYTYSSSDYRWLLYTSPITLMAEHYASGAELMTDSRYLRCLLVVGIWLIVAVLLLWGTMKLYRKRPSEIAESSTSRKPLAQLGVLAGTYIGGSLCGLLFSEMTGRIDERYSFVIWTVIFSALIYILAQVILQRGFKGIRKSLLPGAVTVGVIALFCLILATGGLGYEGRIPAADDVASVSVDYRGRYNDSSILLQAETKTTYEDEKMPGVTFYRYNSKGDVDMDTPEGIAAVQRLHQVASDRSLDGLDYGNRRWASRLIITYTLQNGKTMTRTYDYNELGAVAHELIALENTEEFKRETHPVFLMDAKSFASFNIVDALGFYQAKITDQTDMQRLMDAMAADMMAEDLTKLEDSTELAPCYITFEPAVPTNLLQLTEDAYNYGSVMVRSSYTNTMQVLRQLGLDQFVQPRTEQIAEMRVYYDGRFYGGESPITMMDMGNLQQYAKDMHLSYNVEDEDAMVSVVTDAAQMAQIKEKMFNFGCADTSPMSVVFYDADGNYGGCAQIDMKDLPANVLKVFPDWVWEERGLDVPVAIERTVGIIGGADGPTAIYVTE